MKIPKKILWINFISLAVFIFLMIYFKNNFFTNIDNSVNLFMSQIHVDFLVAISKTVAFLFDTISMTFIALILSAYIWFKHSKKDGVFLAFTMMMSGAFTYVMKDFVARARPVEALVSESSFAFPSGHAVTSVVFFGLLIYLAFREKSKEKTIISLISAIMIVIICLTRLYLNVHWFTDVVGGIALGTFVLTGCILLRERISKKNKKIN
jgi:undecaprenyl-diphosphatase